MGKGGGRQFSTPSCKACHMSVRAAAYERMGNIPLPKIVGDCGNLCLSPAPDQQLQTPQPQAVLTRLQTATSFRRLKTFETAGLSGRAAAPMRRYS
eukprot:2923903-Amphidinium_carterae.3